MKCLLISVGAPIAAEPSQSRGISRPLGIVAASDDELFATERRTVVTRRERIGSCRLVHGSLCGRPVVLVRTGEGRVNAEAGARVLLDRVELERLVIIGFSGGLSPRLPHGAVVVGDRILDDGNPAPGLDRARSAEIARREGAPRATLVTVDRLLCTARSKAEVWEQLGEDRPAAADLESAAVASVAASRGLPYVAIRVISDAATEALPIDFNACVDASGRIRRTSVVARAAVNPAVIGPLWRLRRRARVCAGKLADFLCRSIEGEAR
jgi:adenosylhomocysteine nucleosidase